jgi:hypothetical protein
VEVRKVTTVEEASSLAASLNDSSRERVVIVVTAPTGASEPLIDVERVHAEVGDFADVYLMPTGDPSWEFSASMTPGTQVYGGAGRVYPVGLDWVTDPGRSPLRFAYSPQEAATATTRLIQDAYSAAARAGYGTVSQSGQSAFAWALVQGTPTDTEAIVRLADGRYGVIKSATVFPGVAACRIFVRGMNVQGRYFPDAGLFDVSGLLPITGLRLGELDDDDVLPVYVIDVAFAACTVELLPGWPVTILREQVTGSPADDLCDLLSADEVVLARVNFTAEGALALSMLDVTESDVTRPALSVWPEGPAWLSWPPAELESAEDLPPTDSGTKEQVLESLVAAPAPTPLDRPPTPLDLRHGARPLPNPAIVRPSGSGALQNMSLSLDAARASSAAHETRANIAEERIRLMAAELLRIEAEVAALRQRSERQEQELTRLKTRHRSTLIRERNEAAQPAAEAFTEPDEEFRWQVYSAWVRRIPAGEKVARPLGDYSIGPDFLDSLTSMEGISVAKVAGVVVEVLTGLAEANPSRRMHPLRSGPGGEDATVRRGGAICWRVALQTSTPSARRLHFWRSAEGIELSRVVLHDDFRP